MMRDSGFTKSDSRMFESWNFVANTNRLNHDPTPTPPVPL